MIYTRKPDEVEAYEVCKKEFAKIKKLEGISVKDLVNDKGEFDGIAVKYDGCKKTPKKFPEGSYIVGSVGGYEKRNKEQFEKIWEAKK